MKYRPSTPTSKHASHRYRQRYVGDETLEAVTAKALHYGIFIHQIPEDNPLYSFIAGKIQAANKLVKILDGYVFVFSRSKRLITMYPIPEEFRDDYLRINYLESENREKYRQSRRQS